MAKEATIREKIDFCSEVSLLKHKAGVLGLFKTMHALEAGMKAVGYEVAEHIKKQDKALMGEKNNG